MVFSFSQSPDIRLSLPKRIIIFILALTDAILFGGAVFGWPQLVYLLKKDGIFSNLCEDKLKFTTSIILLNQTTMENLNNDQYSYIDRCGETVNSTLELLTMNQGGSQCPKQDQHFALIFTIAVLFYGLPAIASGFLLHFAGLRISRMLGLIMITASFICLSLTTYESPNWLLPSMVFLSCGGIQLRMTSMQFGDLFPKYRSTTITVLTGIYAASASLFLIFSFMEDVGISRVLVCYFFAAWSFISCLLSFLMPFHHIPYEKDAYLQKIKLNLQTIRKEALHLKKSIFTLSSYLHQYWIFICLLTINLYQQNYNVWVTASSCNVEEVRIYSTWFSYSNLMSVFSAPIGGYFTDYMIKKARKNANNEEFDLKKVQASFIPLLISTLFSISMYSCTFFFNATAIVVSLISIMVAKPCVVAVSAVYLRNRFPAEQFNILVGIYITVAAILMSIQYPMFHWEQSAYYLVHGITIGLLIFALSNPLHLLFGNHLKKSMKLAQDSETTRMDLKKIPHRSSGNST